MSPARAPTRPTPRRPDWMPETAMVLAAGLGKRLRPITDARPKPLVDLGGAALIDHCLRRLTEAGVRRAVVNTHHLGEQIAEHLAGRTEPELIVVPETELWETGGSILRSLDALGPGPFYAVNADILWLDGPVPALWRLATQWRNGDYDALLLVHSIARAVGYWGRGDFLLDADGLVTRRPELSIAPFVYAGVQIVHPRLFENAPEGPFSMNLLWDRAIEAGRVGAVVHDGLWYHVSDPASLEECRTSLAEAKSLWATW